MIYRRILASAILSLAMSPAVLACDAGFEAFKKTVYKKVTTSCAECHDGSRAKAPPFATADASASYEMLLSYMNFSKVDESLLVFRAGNNHCGKENCQEASGKEMAKLGEEWFMSGEKSCERNGRVFSEDMPIPEGLPKSDAGYQTVSIDLSSIAASLKGVSFELEIQDWLGKSTDTRGAYRVRNPRIVGGKNSIYVKNLKVLVNGRYDVIYNQYSTIDRVYPFVKTVDGKMATHALSSHAMLILKDELKNPKISVSFIEVEQRNDAMSCTNQAAFMSQVLPVLKTFNCAQCHNSEAKSVGEGTFGVTAKAQVACGMATSLIDPKFFMVSPLIATPSNGLNSHPMLSEEQRYEYVAAIRSWLNR